MHGSHRSADREATGVGFIFPYLVGTHLPHRTANETLVLAAVCLLGGVSPKGELLPNREALLIRAPGAIMRRQFVEHPQAVGGVGQMQAERLSPVPDRFQLQCTLAFRHHQGPAQTHLQVAFLLVTLARLRES